MPVIYADDFNRPDGPVGGSWVYVPANWQIHVNRLYNGNSGVSTVLHAGCGSYPDLYAEVQSVPNSGGGSQKGIILRADGDGQNCYFFCWVPSSNPPASYGQIYKRVAGVWTKLVELNNAPIFSGTHSVKGICQGNHLQLWLDNTLHVECDDSTFAGGEYAGIAGSAPSTWFDNYDAISALAPSFTVLPESVLADSDGNMLALACNVGNWVPGTPGSPIFTADGGAITAQTVDTVGTATLTYDAPFDPGTVTITDPLNSLNDTLEIVSDPSSCCLEVLRRLGTWPAPDNVYGRLLALARASYPDSASQPNELFSDLIDGTDFTLSFPGVYLNLFTGTKTTTENTDALYNLLLAALVEAGRGLALGQNTNIEVHTISTPAHYSLLDVMNTLKGLSNIDHTNLWDYLHDLRTPSGYTLGDVLLMEPHIRGLDNRDLTQIYNAILAIPPLEVEIITDYLDWITSNHTINLAHLIDTPAYGLHPIKDELEEVHNLINAITDNGANDLQEILDLLQNVHDDNYTYYTNLANLLSSLSTLTETWFTHIHGDLASLASTIATVQADVAYTRTKVDDIWTLLQSHAAAVDTRHSPVWPGLDKVTLGSSIPLSTGFTLAGPLDGVLILITGVPPITGQYSFDGHPSYTHVGAISFVSDRGDFELPQVFGFDHAILTPKSLKRAQSAVGRAKQGLAGTVTPWTINP